MFAPNICLLPCGADYKLVNTAGLWLNPCHLIKTIEEEPSIH